MIKSGRFYRSYPLIIAVLLFGLIFFSMGAFASENDNVVQRGGVGIALLDLGDLNDKLENEGYEAFDSTLFLTKGGAHEDFTENFRMGGIGYRGSTATDFDDGNGQLKLSFAGLLLEGKANLTDNFALLAGGLAGMGSVNLKINESIPGTFSGALENTPNTHELSKRFFGVQPTLVAEASLFSWLTVRASGGYLWGPANKWKMAGKKIDGPLEQVNAPMFALSAHLYIGEDGNG